MLGRKTVWWVAAGLVVAGVVWVLREPAAGLVVEIGEEVRRYGVRGPLVLGAALALAVPLCLPVAPFLFAAGILFDPLVGIAVACGGSVLGGLFSFALGRGVLRAWVERRLARRSRLDALDRALANEGPKALILLRLSPVLPAWLLNYGLGVSRVTWRDYLISSAGVMPAVAVYALIGSGLGNLAALEGGVATNHGPLYYAMLVIGIAATIAVTVLLQRRARRVLAGGVGGGG